MTERFLNLIGPPEIMSEVARLAREHELQMSEPMAMDSTSDALDAPLGIDNIPQILEIATLVATTGTTFVTFFAAVKTLLKTAETSQAGPPQIVLVNLHSGKQVGVLSEETDVSKLEV